MSSKPIDMAKALLKHLQENPKDIEQLTKKEQPAAEVRQEPTAQDLIKAEIAGEAKPVFMSAERFAQLEKSLKAPKPTKTHDGSGKISKEEPAADCKCGKKDCSKCMAKCGDMKVAKDALDMSPKQVASPEATGGKISKEEMGKQAPAPAPMPKPTAPAGMKMPPKKLPAMKLPGKKPVSQ